MTYSVDFRLHVLNFKTKHALSFEETSAHFGISIRSLFRWSKRLEPCSTRTVNPWKTDMDALKKDIEMYPDSYQRERAQRLGVAQSTIFYALKRLKITRKKIAKTSIA